MENTNIIKLREKVKTLPLSSGVYLMKNERGGVIYVGKAKKLRNRVKSYFDLSDKNLKTRLMANQVFDFDYILTNNELDAFNLENTLIKKYKPKYNILLKDDKSFPYIYINRDEKYPRVHVIRRPKVAKGLFGPFVTGMNVWDIIACVKSAFKIRWCNTDFSRVKKTRSCLHGEIGDCAMPCIGAVSEQEYNRIIDDVWDFLSGNTRKIKELLETKMQTFADNEQFEKAIEIRRQLEMVSLIDSNILTDLPGTESLDCFGAFETDELSAVNVMIVRNGKNVGQMNYPNSNSVSELSEMLVSFISSYYSSQGTLPKEIICSQINNEQATLLESFFKQNFDASVKIIVPQKGVKLNLTQNAIGNAKEYVTHSQDRILRHNKLTKNAEDELAEILNIPAINRIEGYDISHISGTDAVASMVVFVDGEPAKKEYRKFKIKTVEKNDDFASLKETLTRRLLRFKNDEKNWNVKPDIILIDGGLGQLNAVKNVVNELGVDIPIISLAKQDEEIFTTENNLPIKLNSGNYALRLLQRVRDESHRFAITYHRLARSKNYKSMLTELDGIGKQRQLMLYKEFKTADAIMSVSVDEIARIPGIGKNLAKNIYDGLHKK